MAKYITDENIRLNIIINGNSAQKELLDLEKTTKSYKKANTELRAEKKKLIADGKKESEAFKNLTKEIRDNNVVIKQNELRMSALQKEIGITGLTMSQLKQRATVLRLALNHAIPGGADEKRYNAELKQISARLTELKTKGQQTKLSLSGIADGFNRYAALGASVVATTTGVVLGLQKIIDYNGKLADAQSDVQKTTGQTKEEVDELTKSFGSLETRTSRIDLLKIAEEGGRIGIAKDEIQDFVAVMNKANVALGDSFSGGVEQVASKLGKLKLLFKETKDIGVEQAYSSIGSAINELGANGVATESNIADFATRLGSLSDDLKPTIQDALGLGAAFEESGVQSEIAGRSYSIFLGEAAQRSDKFAEVMGITTAEVENLINTNPTEFFLQFSETLSETSESGVDTAKTLDKLGLSADGTRKIVGAAGNNVDRFRELLVLSNKSMIEGTSLSNEYNIKNTNLAATLDKVKKRLMGAFSSEAVTSGLNGLVTWIGKLTGAVTSVNEAYNEESKQTVLNAVNYRRLASESQTLLNRYQNLTKEGLVPTTAQKKELDLITLQLKDRLGDSVISIDQETGSYQLNSAAVKEQIKLKALMADKEAVTLISRRLRAKEAIETETLNAQSTKKELDLRREYFESTNAEILKTIRTTSGMTEAGKLQLLRSLDGYKELDVAKQKDIVANETLNTQKQREIDLTNQLKGLNVNETEADKLFKETTESPKEGAEKYVGNTRFIFQGGKWVPQKDTVIPSGGNVSGSGSVDSGKTDETKLTEQDLTDFIKKQREDRLLDGKEGIEKELALIDEKYNAEIEKANENHLSTTNLEAERELEKQELILLRQQEFKDKLNEIEENDKLTAEEKEVEQAELDFEKHTNNLLLLQLNKEEETALLLRLEAAEKTALENINDKYRKQDIKAAEATRKQKVALQNKILDNAVDVAGRETRVGQALLAVKGILAAKETLISLGVLKAKVATTTAGATADIAAGTAKTASAGFPQNIPLLIGFAAQVVGIIAAIKSATSAANSVTATGYEDGLYPVTRAQDGKLFNAKYGGNTKTGMVYEPTLFSTPKGNFLAGEKGRNEPELIVDGAAFKQINPDVKSSFMREIARVKGFEAGLYPTQTSTNVTPEATTVTLEGANGSNTEIAMALNRASAIFEKLENEGIIAYMSDDLRNMKKVQKGLDDYQTLLNKNKR
ncbi:phage tail tape measure protein [Algibacter miyuki]|uniref:Phage tail tape measure protein n=1 Tax=Algibacter miyuki TaxID=1306933 RepID=A0ABV5H3U6_9FLAO|nr:phage tail tape measure protein [Algibacter miyuki]MDN3665641.1 phage tail tape measure protein [Algibacter miyuki]